MAESLVPQHSGEALYDFLTRVHRMVLQLSSGDFLMVQYDEVVLPVYHWYETAGDDITTRVVSLKQRLLDLNKQATTLPELVFTPGFADGWSASIDSAADLARRLQHKVRYCYGPVQVTIYPWNYGFTLALCSRVMRLASAAGVTMKHR
jgi:hypothetical protein